MVVLTQKGENKNQTKDIFRVTGGNERSFTLIKPQGNNRVTARSLPPNFVACPSCLGGFSCVYLSILCYTGLPKKTLDTSLISETTSNKT